MNEQIQELLDRLRQAAARVARYERYYVGEQDLSFATDKFRNAFGSLFREFALNLCPAVCDAVRDKLKISEFSVDAAPQSPGRASIESLIDEIWSSNRMSVRSGELHKEVLKTGEGYAIVWPSPDGQPMIYPQRASSCTAIYDDEIPGRIVCGAKVWRQRDGRTRLNVFFADRIEKYAAPKASGQLPEAADFLPFADDGPPVVPNPYGIVPLFHFANNADVGASGRSELEAAMPIQDALNKSVLDMLVAMEFSAFRQRWVAGIEIEYDAAGKPIAPFQTGIQHLWVAESTEAKFGDFDSADLEQFLKVKDSFRIDMASATGTPLYYLLPQTRGFPSGEALRKAETRFLAKVRDRQEAFGQIWADAISFALAIAGHRGVRLTARWEHPESRSEREILENLLLKQKLGVAADNLLTEAGYGAAEARSFDQPPGESERRN